MAAAERTALAPDVAPNALLALRGSFPSVAARAARRICVTLVPARGSPCPRRSWNPAQRMMRLPWEFRQGPGSMRQLAVVPTVRPRLLFWPVLHRLAQAPVVEVAAAPVPTPPESPHAISHHCILHSCGRRSGSASASPARLASMPARVVAAPLRGSDNRMPPRRRGFGYWVSFPDRGRSCWHPSNHAKCRPGCMRRPRALPPEWRAGVPHARRKGMCPSS